MTDQQPSVRNNPWIAGLLAKRGVNPLALNDKRYENKQVLSNFAEQIDRPYIGAGYPNLLTQVAAVLSWGDLRESGLLEHVSTLLAIGQPFDVCLFKQVYEVYDGDGTTKEFVMRRRPADPVLNPGGTAITGVVWHADYIPRVTRYSAPYGTVGASATEYTVSFFTSAHIDDADPSSGEAWIESDGHASGKLTVARLRLGTAPGAGSDRLVVRYVPLLRMAPDGDHAKSYQEKLVEAHTLKLLEVG